MQCARCKSKVNMYVAPSLKGKNKEEAPSGPNGGRRGILKTVTFSEDTPAEGVKARGVRRRAGAPPPPAAGPVFPSLEQALEHASDPELRSSLNPQVSGAGQ
eukprot:3357733-Pyramimonas_sp.AAC.1